MFPFPILLAIINEQNQLYADFEKEAIPHMDALYNFALRMTGDSDEADDLVQETYLKAFDSSISLKGELIVRPGCSEL